MRELFIQTERLGFGVWDEEDLPLATELWGDALVTRYISGTGVFTPEQIAARLATEIQNGRAHGVQYWPLFALATGEFVGCCGLRPYDLGGGIYEIGFHIKSGMWGKGYGGEAAKAAMAHAYGGLGAKGLFAGHSPHNTASAKLLHKLGFRYSHDAYYAPTGLMHPSYTHTP